MYGKDLPVRKNNKLLNNDVITRFTISLNVL